MKHLSITCIENHTCDEINHVHVENKFFIIQQVFKTGKLNWLTSGKRKGPLTVVRG